ncbi:MAG TPA: hypothetical protein VF997_11745, partial [Polyangia bacterium]
MDDDAPRLFTGHLELIAATPSLARAAATSGAALAELLACEVPRGWPPEPMRDRQVEWATELEADPQLAGWRVWYIVQVRPPLLVGGIGFAGRPDADGVVECRFWLVPRFKRYGWAAEAMG